MSWQLIGKKELISTVPFTVESLDFEINGKPIHPFHRICCPDWVNVLPITGNGQAVLIKQFRAGSLNYVTETPGGMINSDERDTPLQAACRELEEETGYTTDQLVPLQAFNPNPAFHDNKTHFYLALECFKPPTRQRFPDPGEDIEVKLYNLDQLEDMIQAGAIDNSLVRFMHSFGT